MKNHHSSHSNKIGSSLLKPVVLACATAAMLAGCGQRGSLYIPTAPEAAQRSTIVDTFTKPAVSTQQATPDANTAPAK
jgi:predicted small lipoprotein YifL